MFMLRHQPFHRSFSLGGIALFAAGLILAGCSKKSESEGASKKIVEIRVKGSDTMVQLATAWAEAYRKVKTNVFVSASGGGTGTGFAAMQNNTTEICDASRDIKPDEAAKVRQVTGKEPKEFVVAYDALAVYANPSNPVKEISVEELREIWAEGGSNTTWEQINPAMHGTISLFGRQNNSGTYDYFREHICGKKDGKQREFRTGISEMNGSAEVVENVAKTPTGLGYSGMGYKTPNVNWLKVSIKKGERHRAGHRCCPQRKVSDCTQALPLHRWRADRRGQGIHRVDSFARRPEDRRERRVRATALRLAWNLNDLWDIRNVHSD